MSAASKGAKNMDVGLTEAVLTQGGLELISVLLSTWSCPKGGTSGALQKNERKQKEKR